MHTSLTFTGIIPARYESSRFPGKPLVELLGKPMFWHVYKRATQCRLLKSVYLATDDNRIFNSAQANNVPVIMTSKAHKSGTDRVLEAAEILSLPQDSIVVNIQGDEPALAPEMLDQLLNPFISDNRIKVCTLARKEQKNKVSHKNTVKVVFSQKMKALYFSRSIIPYSENEQFCHVHIGAYAFKMKYLKLFSELKQSRLEIAESLEQLRLLEADIPITIALTEHICQGVDTPEDIDKVLKLLSDD